MRSIAFAFFVVLAIFDSGSRAVTIAEPDNGLPWLPVPIEFAQGCNDWTEQLRANNAMFGTLANSVIYDHFTTLDYNPQNFVRYTFAWNDTVTGQFRNLDGEMDVAYHQDPTSSGPITELELFQVGTANFTRCQKHGAYRESSLAVRNLNADNLQTFINTKGPLVGNAPACDMLPPDYFLLTRGGQCAQMEIHLWSKDGKTDYDQDAAMFALGMPIRWKLVAYLKGAIIGSPVDIKIADVLFREGGNVYYELLEFAPGFLQSAQQSRKRSDAPLALQKSWILAKMARHVDQVKVAFPQHADLIDEIVATQM